MLFVQGDLSQKLIAAKVGTSENTLSNWVKEGKWNDLRKSMLISRQDSLRRLYNVLENMTKVAEDDAQGGDTKLHDKISKCTASIRSLETDVAVADMIATAKLFIKHLQNVDMTLVERFTNEFDAFIENRLKTH